MTGDSKYSDLQTRSISGIILLVLAGLAVWFGGYFFLAFLVVSGGCMAWELFELEKPSNPVNVLLAMAMAGALYCYAAGSLMVGFALFIAIIFYYGFILAPSDRGWRGIALICVFFGISALYKLRIDSGIVVTLWMLLCVVASDIGGYFFGRAIGGPKFWPAISPKKTWSGTIGGWVLAAVVSVIFIFAVGSSSFLPVLVGVLVAMFAQAGDLAESSLKRRANVKDSSNLIPGHGGFLDRFDGMTGASLLVFLVQIFGMQDFFY